MISAGTERRAPVLTRHAFQANPGQFRSVRHQVARSLQELDTDTRRRVGLLLGALADEWQHQNGLREELLIVDVEHLPERVRVEAFTHGVVAAETWRLIGESVAPGFADHWGLERRHRSGAWFELEAADEPSA